MVAESVSAAWSPLSGNAALAGNGRCGRIVLKNPQNGGCAKFSNLGSNSRCRCQQGHQASTKVAEGGGRRLAESPSKSRRSVRMASRIVIDSKNLSFSTQSAHSGRSVAKIE
jgi:hypothetical protein